MGRLPLGSGLAGLYRAVPGRKRTQKRGHKSAKHAKQKSACAVNSRRRPRGFYSILGLAPDAPVSRIRQALCQASAQLEKKRQHAVKQQLSAATKLAKQLEEMKRTLLEKEARAKYDEKLFGCGSTGRNRRWRETLGTEDRQFINAKNTAWRRFARHSAHYPKNNRRPLASGTVSYCVPRSETGEGAVETVMMSNTNNRQVPHSFVGTGRWIICKRSKKPDRRFGPFVALTNDELVGS